MKENYPVVASNVSALQKQTKDLQVEVAALMAQVAALKGTVGGVSPDLQAAINQIVKELTPFVK
jgi:hypothetical protein